MLQVRPVDPLSAERVRALMNFADRLAATLLGAATVVPEASVHGLDLAVGPRTHLILAE